MATVYKRKRDAGKRHAVYWIQFRDHDGRRRTEKGYTDKRATEALAAKLEHDAMLRKQGLIDPDQEKAVMQKKTPLAKHVAAFETSIGKNSDKHVRLTMGRIRRILAGSSMETVSDIDIESVEEVAREIMETDDIGHRTYNHYIQAVDQFCNWMVKTKRASSNPLAGLERLNTEVDIRHPRRALDPEEMNMLVESARTSGAKVQAYTGEQRARVYIFSYLTGLRRAEMASIVPTSFDLDAEQPTVRVKAAFSKRRRTDVLPLHAELVAMLREWLFGIQPDEPLFPKLDRKKTWLMVKKDLERVGIPYETEDGIADFHAAGRHTHITELLRNGATLAEARELARHSDIRMTMKYTHIGIKDQAEALANLPVGKNWLHIGCNPGHTDRHSVSSSDTEGDDGPNKNPCGNRGYVTDWHGSSLTDKSGENGGGGNRTRVPRHFHESFYVRSRII